MLKKYIPFIGIVLIAFVGFLDYMIINNALPAIQDSFGISILMLQWLANVYNIVMATTMILFGRLGDIVGHRRIFYCGIFLLLIGSLGAGLSHHFLELISFRAIQTLGISAIIVMGPGLVQFIFQEQSHTPMSVYSSIGGLGLLLGPYVGGVIVTHLGWQWIFLLNVPILLIGSLICIPFVAAFNEHLQKATVDYLGNTLLLISLTTLIYGLIRQQESGLDHTTLSCFITFAVSTALFIYVETHQQHPSLDFRFFQNPDFLLAALSNIMSGALVSCGMFFSPLFLQRELHFSPTTAGEILLSFAIGIVICSPLIGRIARVLHERKTILLGLAAGLLAAIAYLIFFTYTTLIVGMIAFCLTGISLAVNNTTSTLSAIKGVGQKNAGIAIGTIFSIFNMVAAVMLAITTAVLHALTETNTSFAQNKFAYTSVFAIVAAFALISFIVGLCIQRSPSNSIAEVNSQ